jgi:hypothetical protein
MLLISSRIFWEILRNGLNSGNYSFDGFSNLEMLVIEEYYKVIEEAIEFWV